ncbi:hypothetical protein AALP_AA6G294500 [Arabis alpina]|uniref:F-box domain-containing protein n=1 Tax=Arabis alpina TaxID=50452 RepID=A0A087GSJ3_ARAAL|nr:hypothetical protein AALP_AA6G294500 [Arabis alpina]
MSSLPSKTIKKRCSSIASRAGKPRREDLYLSSSPSFSSLPDDVVLNCLHRVPRCYYLNLSCISKTLRSLVRSPELHRLRSLLPKHSLFLSFREEDAPDNMFYWFTLRPIEKKTKIEHRLVRTTIPFPSHSFMHRSSTVAVGSEIFFIGGSLKPSRDLWILDTGTGELTQGPSLKVARTYETVVEEIDGKIYVIGECEDGLQVEVFDPKSRSWKVGESLEEKLQCRLMNPLSASLNGKVYIVETGRIAVYDPREGGRLETVEMQSDIVWCMCVVADVLYAYYFLSGLMWFDTKRKIWCRVVGERLRDAKYHDAVMAEYNGKLAILWPNKELHSAKNERSNNIYDQQIKFSRN